jgi:hypothetical protein
MHSSYATNRLYVLSNNTTGLDEWFFMAREGTFGPYPRYVQVSC